MPAPPIPLLDPDKIPRTSEPNAFHANATYVFDYLEAEGIPGFNALGAYIEAALAGDTTTLIGSLSAHLADVGNPHAVTAAQVGAPSVAEMAAGLANVDAVTFGGQAPAFYRDAASLDAGRVPDARLSGSYAISVSFATGAGNANTLNGYVAGDMANGVSRKVSGTQVTAVAFWNHAPAGHVITGFWRHPSSGLQDIFFTHAIQIQLHNGVWVTMAG